LLGTIILAGVGCQSSSSNLLTELRHRGQTEGLALISIRANYFQLVTFEVHSQELRNPRGLSIAEFSADSKVVAWDVCYPPTCCGSIMMESLTGKLLGRLPGEVNATIAVSNDGKKLALNGIYKPPGTGRLAIRSNTDRWKTGLQLAFIDTGEVGSVCCWNSGFGEGAGSISWSPDSAQFAYDLQGNIYIFSLADRNSRLLCSGAHPTWSPDGKWIAFVESDGQATLIDPATSQRKALAPGHRIICAVHWSPDMEYVAFAERFGGLNNLLHEYIWGPSTFIIICRLRDGATAPVYSFGIEGGSDCGFSWIKNYKEFLSGLAADASREQQNLNALPCLPER